MRPHLISINESFNSEELSTQDEKPTQVTSAPQPLEVNSARATTEQDSAVALEARAQNGLDRGYTRIPNAILMRLVGGEFTRNEIRIVLVIARFTISFRKEMAPLSKRVLERQSALQGAAVLEAVSGLVRKGLVLKTKGDHYRPNMLGLVLPDDWQCVANKTEPDQSSILTPNQPKTELPSQVETATQGEAQLVTPFKDIKKYKNKNSHNPLSGNLRSYFSNLKPARKYQSEWSAFLNLRKDFDQEDIDACLKLLIDRGVKTAGFRTLQRCHSPMAYLTKAINDVFQDVIQQRGMASVVTDRIVEKQKIKAVQLKRSQENAAHFDFMEKAFLLAHPRLDHQQIVIDDICRNLPFRSSAEIQRIYAIQEWFACFESKARRGDEGEQNANGDLCIR